MIKYRLISKPDPKSPTQKRFMAQRKILGIWVNTSSYWAQFEETAMEALNSKLTPTTITVVKEFDAKPSWIDKLLGLDK